jgi:ABC-type transport system involved in cytochrome bd biosynthesis fused ATPase/permease subunit
MDMTMESLFCIGALIAAQAWIQERKEGVERTVVYHPKELDVGEKRGMRIEARGLSFRYPSGQVDALRNINITIGAGETLAIVGFNGGGMSSASYCPRKIDLPQESRRWLKY